MHFATVDPVNTTVQCFLRVSRLTFLLHFLLVTSVAGSESDSLRSDVEQFDRTIAPILAGRCLECHSGVKPDGGLDLSFREKAIRGGDSGPAFISGKLQDSLIWQRIESGEMPPKHPLPEDERQVLRTWLEAGGRWGTDPIDPYRFSTTSRAGYDWWSFQPFRALEPPKGDPDTQAWVRNGIDAFIFEKLKEKGLRPSAPADPRTLIRRVYFDLIGLPPTPEVIEKFSGDPSEEHYQKIVDELLSSPQYGERWGQHWLDVVRYGESGGFERNEPRKNSWPYRDWVIQALNADMPYDEFVRAQLSADLLDPGIEGAAASGFLVAGVHNTVVGSSERMRKLARQDELEELAGTVGQTFLGLTIQCARCHSHKFDPVSTEEYYQFISALDGVNHGEREFVDPMSATRGAQLREQIELDERILREMLDRIQKQTALQVLNSDRKSKNIPQPIAAWDFEHDLRDQVGSAHGEAKGGARIEGGKLVLNGKDAFVKTASLNKLLTEKTFEAWVVLDDLDQRGGGVMTVESNSGGTFDSIVYGEQEAKRWMAGSDSFMRTQSFSGTEELEAIDRPIQVAISYSGDGVVTGYRNGVAYGKSYRTGLQRFPENESHIAFGIRHSPAGGNRMFAGKILRAKLYDRALSPEEISASASTSEPAYISESELVERMNPEDLNEYRRLREEISELRGDLKRLTDEEKQKVYAVVGGPLEPMRVHLRGDVTNLANEVTPGGVRAVAISTADFGIDANATDRERRLKLAAWMTDPQNTLFQRVITNRIWHYHFGAGIVETPNDFGFNGGRPSHPELLDWLTAQFKNYGMRWKPLHRLIVLSSTYRQTSVVDSESIRVDAGNRWLWRFTPHRLEGETLRDALLAASGLLDVTPGGPGFQDVTVTPNNGTTYYEPIDTIETGFRRRTIYRFIPRGGRSAILDTFDCPDPSVTTPRRPVTTTPLQALSLMNNAFVLDASEHLAERAVRETSGNEKNQIQRVWQLILGRPPDDREMELSMGLIHEHGLSALSRALFNSNEFVVVE